MYIMKSRGMKHSNQVREFVIKDTGLDLVDVYLGPDGVLTGSARESQQLMEATRQVLRHHALSRKDKEIARKKTVFEARIESLKEEFESIRDELNKNYVEEDLKSEIMKKNREEMTQKRSNDHVRKQKK